MGNNSSLIRAKVQKNDEYYTKEDDIAKELSYYEKYFKNKIVYCNCDNPEYSNFWKYFRENFTKLGLKKLISTYYDKENMTSMVTFDGDREYYKKLRDYGDFRSIDCLCQLYQSDIVVTNPPFSLSTDFITILLKSKKDFLVVGDLNWITYSLLFPYIKRGDVRLGVNSIKSFIQPDGTIKRFGNKVWFTTLDHDQESEFIPLQERYHKKKHRSFQNYEALNVDKISQIPYDYTGIVAVPISFLQKYNSKQFDLLGLTSGYTLMYQPVMLGDEFIDLYKKQGGTGHYSANMYGMWYIDNNGKVKIPYRKLLIRRK